MLLCGHVPVCFGRSFTIPIPKVKDCRTKALTTDDFRGIAISCVLSKVYELCIYDRFQHYLCSCDNQFGFKKNIGCSHAIYSVRKIVEKLVKEGNTVNLCALDLSKAFDKTDHHALFIKLMKRHVPIELLTSLENWFSNCFTCVKWGSSLSKFFQINLGVRQGSVLSPFLFAIYVDDIVSNNSVYNGTFIILYADDDILLIAPSIHLLQSLLHFCESELNYLNMLINAKKSCCLRIGPRFDFTCANINTLSGQIIPWVEQFRYLGVFIVQSRVFKVSTSYAKRSFYKALNSIYGKIGRFASEDVVLHLVNSKCVPVLIYGLEACPLNSADKKSLDFALNRFLFKLFKTSNKDVVDECSLYFGLYSASDRIARFSVRFINRFNNSDNLLCQLVKDY